MPFARSLVGGALVAMMGCPPAPSPPAAAYAYGAPECVREADSGPAADACRARARAQLCAAEPEVCNDGGQP